MRSYYARALFLAACAVVSLILFTRAANPAGSPAAPPLPELGKPGYAYVVHMGDRFYRCSGWDYSDGFVHRCVAVAAKHPPGGRA